MPRFVVVTVNDYHDKEPVKWCDGERHVFYHGGEFEASFGEARSVLLRLKGIGRSTVELTSDSNKVPGHDYRLATIDSVFASVLYDALGSQVDAKNPAAYVTTGQGAEFQVGDQFMLGELILAEVQPDGLLVERDRLTLRNPGGDERHAVEVILDNEEALHARIRK